ncbi:hypothetical protein [Leucobacter massiliensis]|nr:hypothetical protein [Leucobacter massiliensis]
MAALLAARLRSLRAVAAHGRRLRRTPSLRDRHRSLQRLLDGADDV